MAFKVPLVSTARGSGLLNGRSMKNTVRVVRAQTEAWNAMAAQGAALKAKAAKTKARLPTDLSLPPRLNQDQLAKHVATQSALVMLAPGVTPAERATAVQGLVLPYLQKHPVEGSATADQVAAFIAETVVHITEVVETGFMRGKSFIGHDFAGADASKFNPTIAAGLARPDRNDTVVAAIKKHNDSPHHQTWSNKTTPVEQLTEAATDIVAALRQKRSYKDAWTYRDIMFHIDKGRTEGWFSPNQAQALTRAVTAQRRYERLQGAAT
jgi:hypothetical protein